MRKILLITLIVASVLGVWFMPASFDAALLSLLVLGLIPGTTLELGAFLPIIAIGIATLLSVLWMKEFSAELMMFKTKEALREEQLRLQINSSEEVSPEKEELLPDTEEIDLFSI